MYTARNRRAATPPNITPQSTILPARYEAETPPPAAKRPAAKPAQPRKVASKKERARKARLVRNKARAARKANASKPRKDKVAAKVAAKIAAPRPTGQPVATPPVIALPQLPEPLVEPLVEPFAPLAVRAPASQPSAASNPLPRAPDGSRPAVPPPAGRPSASGTALVIPRPPLVIQLAEWIDRRLREVWRTLGGQPPRKRRAKPRMRVASRPDAPPLRAAPSLPAEELARLRAENAALRRQLEALLALSEPLTPA